MRRVLMLGSFCAALTSIALATDSGSCTGTLRVGDCDSGVPALRGSTCLQDQIDSCASFSEHTDFMTCLSSLQPFLGDDEFASVFACGVASDPAEGKAGARNTCKGRFGGTLEDLTVTVEVCAKNEGKAIKAAKDAAVAEAAKLAEMICAPVLNCAPKQCPQGGKDPRQCKLETKIVGNVKGTAECTATTKQCNPPVPGSVLWDCDVTADFAFQCGCACVK